MGNDSGGPVRGVKVYDFDGLQMVWAKMDPEAVFTTLPVIVSSGSLREEGVFDRSMDWKTAGNWVFEVFSLRVDEDSLVRVEAGSYLAEERVNSLEGIQALNWSLIITLWLLLLFPLFGFSKVFPCFKVPG